MPLIPAGRFKHRFEFYKRVAGANDGYGNVRYEWQSQFTVWANLSYRDGNEEVIAGTIAGKQPAFLYIRLAPETNAIGTDWFCRDVNRSSFIDDGNNQSIKGAAFNIKAIYPDPINNRYLRLVLEAGTALG